MCCHHFHRVYNSLFPGMASVLCSISLVLPLSFLISIFSFPCSVIHLSVSFAVVLFGFDFRPLVSHVPFYPSYDRIHNFCQQIVIHFNPCCALCIISPFILVSPLYTRCKSIKEYFQQIIQMHMKQRLETRITI